MTTFDIEQYLAPPDPGVGTLRPNMKLCAKTGLYLLTRGCLRVRRHARDRDVTLNHLKAGDLFQVTPSTIDYYEALAHCTFTPVGEEHTTDFVVTLVRQLERAYTERAMAHRPIGEHVMWAVQFLAVFCGDGKRDRLEMHVQTLAESINRDLTVVVHALAELEDRGRLFRKPGDVIQIIG